LCGCVEKCFVEGIGVTLEDALEFWRSEFAQKVGTQVFEKQYAYNIRYILPSTSLPVSLFSIRSVYKHYTFFLCFEI
jgi:hypothetical protein